MNGNESDIDCGGQCQGCAIGTKCNTNSDCVTKNCQAGKCARKLYECSFLTKIRCNI
jgi:hypothetical protein